MCADRLRQMWHFGKVDPMNRRRWLGSYGGELRGCCLGCPGGDRGYVGIVVDLSGLGLGRRRYATGLGLMGSSGGAGGERDSLGNSGRAGFCS